MSGWPQVPLGEILQVKHGFAFKGEYFEPTGDQLVMTPGNFKIGGGLQLRDGKERFYSGPYPDEYRLSPGDLLIALTDLTQSSPILGSPLVVPFECVFLHNQRLGRVEIVDKGRLDRRFAYFLFASDVVRSQLRASATGSTVRHTAPGRIYSASVGLPPLPTQRKIAAILSTYDDLVENNGRRIELLEELAQRIYREWFVEYRYPGHDSVPLVESEMGQIPHGWSVAPFAKLGDYVNGYAFKPEDWGTQGLPIVKIRELKNGVTDETPRYVNDLEEKYVVRDGDLLFSWSAHLDAYLWTGGRAWLNQHLFRVDPVADVASTFLFHALRERMEEFRGRAQGTTMRHIKRAVLAQVSTVLPPEELRSAMVCHLAPIDALTLDLVRATRSLRATRDLLLPRLISGEVNVADIDIATAEDPA